MNWKLYEKEIFNYFKMNYKDCDIKSNVKIIGRYSKVERQIDILVECNIAGFIFKIVVDCKYYNKKVDVKHVESFIGMINDLDGVQKGLIITEKGFTKAAINRAFNNPFDISIDIFNFEALKQGQGIAGFAYRGHNGVILIPPLGWIVDSTYHSGDIVATLYQRGCSFNDAVKNTELMYINIINKNQNEIKQLNDIIKLQEKRVNYITSIAEITYEDIVIKNKPKTIMRKINYKNNIFVEFTAFIEFEEFIFYCVLSTPIGLIKRNYEKLLSVVTNMKLFTTQFNNDYEASIWNLETYLGYSKTDEERAYYANRIAMSHKKYNNIQKAIEVFEYMNTLNNKSYEVLKEQLSLSLELFGSTKSRELSQSFFDIDPHNPTIYNDLHDIYTKSNIISNYPEPDIPQDLINIYESGNKDLLILYKILLEKYKIDNVVVANINYYMGMCYVFLNMSQEAINHLELSKKLFSDIYPKDHYIFKLIENNLKKA